MQVIPFCDSLLEAAGELTLKVWGNEIPEIPVPFRLRLYRYLVRYYYMPESSLNFAAVEDGSLRALLLAAPVRGVHSTDADRWIREQLKNEEEKQVFSAYKNYLDSNRAAEKKFAGPDDAVLLLFESVRKGAGKMLLQEFERSCRDQKIPGMILWTDETCDFDYYNRNGFTAVADFQSVPLFGRRFRTWLFRKEFPKQNSMEKYALNIRKAEAAESEIMADIQRRSWKAAYSGLLPEETIRQINETRSALWKTRLQAEQTGETSYFLAEINGTPAGMISFGAYRENPASSTGEIHAIYLLPNCFRRGIGTALLDFAMRELKKHGYQQVCLWVLSTNRNAIAFYEKNGFTQDLSKQEIIGETVTELRYSRTL